MLSQVFGCILRQVDILLDICVTHELFRNVIRTSAVWNRAALDTALNIGMSW